MNLPTQFSAFRIHQDEAGYRAGLESTSIDDLNAGDMVIRVTYSSVNYKDALAGTGRGDILRRFPLIGGIDVTGIVVNSENAAFKAGDAVLVTGCGLSETRDGGYSEYLRLDSQWAIPLPAGLSARDAMIMGTAGFTAALSLYRMEACGQQPDMGPIVVTGASGGVGSLAIDILTTAGYDVHAISGKTDQFPYLEMLGAKQCISRHGLDWDFRPLLSAKWAGAIDNVGGDTLSGLTRMIKPWGNIASCGLAGGTHLSTTVFPFIIRGIGLLGINSAGCPYAVRQQLWQRLATDWRPAHLEKIMRKQITLDQLSEVFDSMLSGNSIGRIVVTVGGEDDR